jgi:hypothetical protein
MARLLNLVNNTTGRRPFEWDGEEEAGMIFFLLCEAIGTEATPGLLCQPLVVVKMIVEKHLVSSLICRWGDT